MKYLILILAIISISCVRTVEKKVYVDRVVYVRCPTVKSIELKRPKLRKVEKLCSVDGLGNLLKDKLDLIEFAKLLEWQLKRYEEAQKQCEEMMKEEGDES